MLKAGGGNWTHAISADGVHWYHIADALGRGPSNSTWDNQGACDGTVSFPDLGKAPFDGSTPIIMYGPDCGKPIPKPPSSAAGGVAGRAGVGDAPRVEIALPADVATDPFLTNWVKTQPGPVTFEGTPCSFPGRVWKSKVGDYWNMLCAIQTSCTHHGCVWARYTSSDPKLMTWKMADTSFTQGKDTGKNGARVSDHLPFVHAGSLVFRVKAVFLFERFLSESVCLGRWRCRRAVSQDPGRSRGRAYSHD